MMVTDSLTSNSTQVMPYHPAHELRVSAYEKVASLLLSLLMLTGIVVLVLFMVWLGSRVKTRVMAVPVNSISPPDAGGGYENGVLGEDIELPGEVTTELGTGLERADPEFSQAMQAVAATVVARSSELEDPNLTEQWSTGGIGGARGTGNAPSLGEGGGSGGGVRRPMRWIIEFDKGATLDSYAAQLDFFKIELGVLDDTDQITYANNLSAAAPSSRSGPRTAEKRLYFSWRDGTLQQADRQLLSRAGVDATGKIVLQFYPAETEELLAVVEAEFLKRLGSGRDIRTVRRTRFVVVTEDDGYSFLVRNQTYLSGR